MPKILDTALQDPEVLRDLYTAISVDQIRRRGGDPTALAASSPRRKALESKRALLIKLKMEIASLHKAVATQQIKSSGEARLKAAELWLAYQNSAIDYSLGRGNIQATTHRTMGGVLNAMTNAISDDSFVKRTPASEALAAKRMASISGYRGDWADQKGLANFIADDLAQLPGDRGTAAYIRDVNNELAKKEWEGVGYPSIEKLVQLEPDSQLAVQYRDFLKEQDASNEAKMVLLSQHGDVYKRVLRGAGAPDLLPPPDGLIPTAEQLQKAEDKSGEIVSGAAEDSGLQDWHDALVSEIDTMSGELNLSPAQTEVRLLNSDPVKAIAESLGVTRAQGLKYAKRQAKKVKRGKVEAFTPEDAKLRQFGKATRKAHRQEQRDARKAGEELEDFQAEASTPEEERALLSASRNVKMEGEALMRALDLGGTPAEEPSAAAAAVEGAEPPVDALELEAERAREATREGVKTAQEKRRQILMAATEAVT